VSRKHTREGFKLVREGVVEKDAVTVLGEISDPPPHRPQRDVPGMI